MRAAVLALGVAVIVPAAAVAQTDQHPRELRFTGPSATQQACECLLEAGKIAEAQGRLDFNAEVELTPAGEATDVTARIWMRSAYSIGRINFDGHSTLNDSTLRRALTIYERDVLDVRQLRRSLARINDIGVFEPLTLSDISVVRRVDGVTADLTIALRERKRRWWSLSGPIVPGIGMLRASVSSRLPPWGRGIFETTTYAVSLNVTGFTKPFLALERPIVPGQELLSGFSIARGLSPRAMLMNYGTTHAAHGVGALLDYEVDNPMAVPIVSAGQLRDEPLVCVPPKPRLWWLRRGAAMAINMALTSMIF